MTDGDAKVTALAADGGNAEGGASVFADAHAVGPNDNYADSSSRLIASAKKNRFESLAYSDSNAVTNAESYSEDGGAYATSGEGVSSLVLDLPALPATMNEAGALASDYYLPYPHEAATYSNSEAKSFANFPLYSPPGGVIGISETDKVAVIDIQNTNGELSAEARADASADARGVFDLTGLGRIRP